MTGAAVTKSERNDLAVIMRKRERVMKAAARQRSKELLVDFEKQLGAVYSFDDDETWKAANAAAEQAVRDAQATVAERCEELGIPKEFRPAVETLMPTLPPNEVRRLVLKEPEPDKSESAGYSR